MIPFQASRLSVFHHVSNQFALRNTHCGECHSGRLHLFSGALSLPQTTQLGKKTHALFFRKKRENARGSPYGTTRTDTGTRSGNSGTFRCPRKTSDTRPQEPSQARCPALQPLQGSREQPELQRRPPGRRRFGCHHFVPAHAGRNTRLRETGSERKRCRVPVYRRRKKCHLESSLHESHLLVNLIPLNQTL